MKPNVNTNRHNTRHSVPRERWLFHRDVLFGSVSRLFIKANRCYLR
ncbi:hypothetical protein RRSWK_00836 [Rhodopirellula sp. SWK7]|nr:hypothetical protein RRSWK_00836 [Rhodopirellula sp. SWK7]